MSAYPLEFCQCQEDAYMVTDSVQDSPAILYSSLNKDRLNYEKQFDFYSMSISSKSVGEYLYASKSDMKISSYADLPLSGFFMPIRKMLGIDSNYIV